MWLLSPLLLRDDLNRLVTLRRKSTRRVASHVTHVTHVTHVAHVADTIRYDTKFIINIISIIVD